MQHLLGTFDYLAFHWEEEVHQELVFLLLVILTHDMRLLLYVGVPLAKE